MAEPRERTDAERLIAVRKYLRRVREVPESVLGGGYEALVTYFQGSLN